MMIDWIIFALGILSVLSVGLKLHDTWMEICGGDGIYKKVVFLYLVQIIVIGTLLFIFLEACDFAIKFVENINPGFYDSSSPLLIAVSAMIFVIGLSATIGSLVSRLLFEIFWKRAKPSDVIVVFKVVEYLLQWSIVLVVMSLIVSIGLLSEYKIGSVGDINRMVVSVAVKESFEGVFVNGIFLGALISNSLLKIHYQLGAKIESEINLFDAYDLISNISHRKDSSYFEDIYAVVELTDRMNYRRILKAILIREQTIAMVDSDILEGDRKDEKGGLLDDGGGGRDQFGLVLIMLSLKLIIWMMIAKVLSKKN